MTILDKLFGGDDPPKKKYVAPMSTIADTVDDLGFKGMLGLIQKAASNPNAYSNPIRNVPYYSETEGPMMIREGSKSKEGLPPGMMIRKIEGEKGNKYYLRMKDNPPMPVSEYFNPELFQFLESNNPDKAEMARLIQGLLGGTSNTPGGSAYGFADGIDGGGLLQGIDIPFKQTEMPKALKFDDVPPFLKLAEPLDEVRFGNRFGYRKEPRFNPLIRPFEWIDFDSGIKERKPTSLFELIAQFTKNINMEGLEPVQPFKFKARDNERDRADSRLQ